MPWGPAGATSTIYLNRDWLTTASTAAVQAVLTEEFGHHLDQLLSEKDTQGDEGEVFANALIDPRVNFKQKNNPTEGKSDEIKIFVKGKWIVAEAALPDPTDRSDTITGTANSEIIKGLGGADSLDGQGGNDTIHGGAGKDSIHGGLGNDSIWGQDGADTLGETIQMTPSPVETTQLKAIKGKTAFMAAPATIRSQVEMHPQISFMAAMEMI